MLTIFHVLTHLLSFFISTSCSSCFFLPSSHLSSRLMLNAVLFLTPSFIICLISSFFRLQSAYSYGSCPLFLLLLDFLPFLPPHHATFSLIIFPTTFSPSSSPSFSVLLVSSRLVRMCRSTSFLLRVRRCRSVWRSWSRRCQEELQPLWHWSSTISSISPMLVWTHTCLHRLQLSVCLYLILLQMFDRNIVIYCLWFSLT